MLDILTEKKKISISTSTYPSFKNLVIYKNWHGICWQNIKQAIFLRLEFQYSVNTC